MTDIKEINFNSKLSLLKEPTIVDEIIKQQTNQLKQSTDGKFIYFICVPNIKVPTWQQMLELRSGTTINEITKQAREHFKKEEL